MYKLETTPLYAAFFTDSNMQRIQRQIQENVKRSTGTEIGPQNSRDLYNIMQSVYSVNSSHVSEDVAAQIEWMNSVVTQKAVKQIVTGLSMYQHYIGDLSTGIVPPTLPVSTTQYGKKFDVGTRIGW